MMISGIQIFSIGSHVLVIPSKSDAFHARVGSSHFWKQVCFTNAISVMINDSLSVKPLFSIYEAISTYLIDINECSHCLSQFVDTKNMNKIHFIMNIDNSVGRSSIIVMSEKMSCQSL